MRRFDWLIAVCFFLGVSCALLVGSRGQGFTRDEGYYFVAAENHVGYYEEAAKGLFSGRPLAFADRRVIDRWFHYNNEHPPLLKSLFGLSWRLLHKCRCDKEPGLHPRPYPNRHRTLGLLSQGDAMRLPAHLLCGLLCAAVYLFGVAYYSRRMGLLSAALCFLLPRHFFHAQLACFDAPIAAMIGLTTLCYFQAQASGKRGWLVACAVLAGLSLSTKHNAFFLPFALFAHSLYARRSLPLVRRVFAPWIFYMAVISIPVYLLSWPWLWFDTVRRFSDYVAFHLHHVYYNMEYLGQNYNKPPFPWHFVPVMTLLTAPITTLSLAGFGTAFALGDTLRRKTQTGAGFLLLLAACWPMLVIMRPGTPIFGAEKHWLPAMPFVALLAGLGFDRLYEGVSSRLPRPRELGYLLCGLLALGPALEVARSHPYGLSHYNALAGGPKGGADLGMNRQFWGYAVRGLFPLLSTYANDRAPIYWHDANLYMLQMSEKDGFLSPGLVDSGMEEPGVRNSDLALVIHEMHFNKYEYWIWDAYGHTKPSAVLTHEGVPVVTFYKRAPK